MLKDEKAIDNFIENLNNSTTSIRIEAHGDLLRYIEKQRVEALGWMLAECCNSLDAGVDPRYSDQSEMLDRALKELSQ